MHLKTRDTPQTNWRHGEAGVGMGGVCQTEDPSVNESRRYEASAMTPPTSTLHFDDLSAWRAPRHLLVSCGQLQT